jgi:thiol-disulfide isomerase/thioredoxin
MAKKTTKDSVNSPSEIKEKFSDAETKSSVKPIVKIFNFNTEWCGWSRRFQPEWDAFIEYVKNPANNLKHVQAFDVKCDNDENKQMCEEYKVPGYPYVIVEVNGKRRPYEGERTKDALVSYVKSL